MRRADRLIQITHYLRSRTRAVTAAQIGEAFGICTRTVYRDLHALMEGGAPITGEAGVGYVIDKRYYLPPIAFDDAELEAIGLGISMVRQWTDPRFAAKAESAFAKINAVLPAAMQGALAQITTFSLPVRGAPPWTVSFSDLRDCIREGRAVELTYTDDAEVESIRRVRPLALMFFSPVWLLAGWCEMRGDFRHFRLDRIVAAMPVEVVATEPGQDLTAYLAHERRCQQPQRG